MAHSKRKMATTALLIGIVDATVKKVVNPNDLPEEDQPKLSGLTREVVLTTVDTLIKKTKEG